MLDTADRMQRSYDDYKKRELLREVESQWSIKLQHGGRQFIRQGKMVMKNEKSGAPQVRILRSPPPKSTNKDCVRSLRSLTTFG